MHTHTHRLVFPEEFLSPVIQCVLCVYEEGYDLECVSKAVVRDGRIGAGEGKGTVCAVLPFIHRSFVDAIQ